MGRVFAVTLEGKVYCCKHCATHLGLADNIISKSLILRNRKLYVFEEVVNITFGKKDERLISTGMLRRVEIFCVRCNSRVGWEYETPRNEGPVSILKRYMVKVEYTDTGVIVDISTDEDA